MTHFTAYFGPPVDASKTAREQMLLEENRTASLDSPFFPIRSVEELKKGNGLPEKSTVVAPVREVNPTVLKVVRNEKKLFELHAEWIDYCAERRFWAFWMQAISVYKTGLIFLTGNLPPQPKNARVRILSCEDDQEEFICEAAHTSAIPVLLARKRGSDQKHLFLEGSDAATNWSTNCMVMPANFNQKVDRDLDEWGQNNMRKVSIAILNRVSKGRITPLEGLHEYGSNFGQLAEEKSNEDGIKNSSRYGLQRYAQAALRIQRSLSELSVLENLLDLRFAKRDRDDGTVIDALCALRCSAIQSLHFEQSSLIGYVDGLLDIIRTCSNKKKLAYIEISFQEVIVNCATHENRPRLRQLFNLPSFEKKDHNRDRLSRISNSMKALLNVTITLKFHSVKNPKIIRRLKNEARVVLNKTARQIGEDMEELRLKDQMKRVETAKQLLALRHLTSEELSNFSLEERAKIENGEPIDDAFANRLSEILEFPTEILHPSTFYSYMPKTASRG